MILPITIRRNLTGRNAVNWPGFVILGRGIERPAATWAQEAWEACTSWKIWTAQATK